MVSKAVLPVLAGALIGLGASGQVQAADQVPAGPATKRTVKLGQRLQGSIDYPQDVDWTRIIVKPGENYVAGIGNFDGLTTEIDIYHAKHRLVAKDKAGNAPPFAGADAVKFLAPSSPLYIACKLGKSSSGTRYPAGYAVAFFSSCAPKTATRCTAEIGEQRTFPIRYADDAGWYRVPLQAGHGYTLGATYNAAFACDFESAGTANVGLADACGKIVVKPSPVHIAYDDGDKQCPDPKDAAQPKRPAFSFRAAKAGTYYVTVQSDQGFSREDASANFALKGK